MITLIGEALDGVNVWRITCDTSPCQASIEAPGVWTIGARLAVVANGWTSRKGAGVGSGHYPRTDHCPEHWRAS
jgi:hypothetical protein